MTAAFSSFKNQQKTKKTIFHVTFSDAMKKGVVIYAKKAIRNSDTNSQNILILKTPSFMKTWTEISCVLRKFYNHFFIRS